MEAVVDLGYDVNMTLRLRSAAFNLVFSARARRVKRGIAEWRRRLARQPHVVTAFLQLDDPYSYLLSHYLSALESQYDIELRVYLTQALKDGFQAAPELWPEYATEDCARLARELGIPFLDKGASPPVEMRRALLDMLAYRSAEADFGRLLGEVLALYWRGDVEALARRMDAGVPRGVAADVIDRSQALLKKLGHYNAAMLHYGGEWYWGVDRLHYLASRLDGLGIAKQARPSALLASIQQAMQFALPVRPPAAARGLPPLEVFMSFRSPYSYLCLQRVFAIADAFGLTLVLRPVLPMVQRNLAVPRQKLLYIAEDAAREAERLRVPFGRMADPVGKGAERCLAVFRYAVTERRARDFVLHAGEAIWSRGIDVATDKGMRKVTARAGLFWPEVKAALQDDAWRAEAEANRAAMTASGAWGVPTMRLGDFVTWGQDRDWLLVRHIEECCDTGEGILV